MKTLLFSLSLIVVAVAFTSCGEPAAETEEKILDENPDMEKVEVDKSEPEEEITTETGEGKPVIEFKEMTYDFGTLQQGDVVKHDFVFTNTGEAPVEITDVIVTCGCTTPFKPEGPIAPGEESKITVQFNSEKKAGAIRKTVKVMTSAQSEPVEVLFTANVEVPQK